MTALTPAQREHMKAANSRASKIRSGIVDYLETLGVIAKAYQERDWEALEYDGWDTYVDSEFGAERLRLSPEHRQKAVIELRLAGLSQRAIGSTLGVSKGTVHADLNAPGAQNRAPDEVTGVDGKAYPPARPPLVEALTGAIEDAEQRAEDHRGSSIPGEAEPVRGVATEPGTAAEGVGRSSQGVVPAPSATDPGVAAPAEEADVPAAPSPVSSGQGGPATSPTGPPCEKCRGDLEPGAHEDGFLQCADCDPNGSHIANEYGKCGLCLDLDALVASVPEAYRPLQIVAGEDGLYLRCSWCTAAVAPLRAGMPLAVPLVEANAHNCPP